MNRAYRLTDPDGEPIEGYTFEDSEVLRDDELFWQPKWKDGRKLGALSKQCIELQMDHEKLYAIRGDFVPCAGDEIRKFKETGEEPVTRLGF